MNGAGPGLAFRSVRMTVPDGTATRVLLDDVDLDVAPGEITVVTGPSGSGKTTMLAAAGLLRRPDAGDVFVAGTSTELLSERKRTALRRAKLAIVYQHANLVASLTAREQLELVGNIHGERRSTARRRAAKLLAEFGVPDRAGVLPGRLSGGERQRVGIARALMARPSVLLADEPTASLNPELAQQVVALLVERARAAELATVIVTHDALPLAHADRHLHLEDGSLREMTPRGT